MTHLVLLLIKLCLPPPQPPPTAFAVWTEGERSLVLRADKPLAITLLNRWGAKRVFASDRTVFDASHLDNQHNGRTPAHRTDRAIGKPVPALAVDGFDLDDRDPRIERGSVPSEGPFRIGIAGDVSGAHWTDALFLRREGVGGSVEPASTFEAYARAWANSVHEPFQTFTSSVVAFQLGGEVDVLSSCQHGGPCKTYVRFRGRDVHRTLGRVHGLLELADGQRYLVTLDAGFAIALFELPVIASATFCPPITSAPRASWWALSWRGAW